MKAATFVCELTRPAAEVVAKVEGDLLGRVLAEARATRALVVTAEARVSSEIERIKKKIALLLARNPI